MSDDWDESVSMRLACLALDRGRLTDDLVTALAVRGTLLVDLALRGRVAETADGIDVDVRPSGFPPADRLVGDGAPPLTHLLRRGDVDQEDLAVEHLHRGSWTREPRLFRTRYTDHRADRTEVDERAVDPPRGDRCTPADAALTAIAGTLGLLASPRALPTEELLAATGPVRWLVEVIVEEVHRAISRGRFMSRAVGFSDGTPG